MANKEADWKAIREMMNAAGSAYPARVLAAYLNRCSQVFGDKFDAMRALKELRDYVDLLIVEIERERQK